VQSQELLDGVGDQLRVGPQLALERAVGGEGLHDGGNRDRGGDVPGDKQLAHRSGHELRRVGLARGDLHLGCTLTLDGDHATHYRHVIS
jgi:hypothetical protein